VEEWRGGRLIGRRTYRENHAMRRRLHLLSTLIALTVLVTPLAAQDIVERMEREHAGDSPISNPLSETVPETPIRGSEAEYAVLDDNPVNGYLARPAEGEIRGGLIVIHEWWGLNDNIRAMADRFAGEGYAALAVDLYEGEVADTRDGAAALMRGTLERPERLKENLRQAHRYLAGHVGADSIGVVGWCFGGAWSLRTGLMMGDEIDATVIYYGRLVTEPGELDALTSPLLGLFGELDGGIPVETVREFEAALEKLGKESEILVYPDADHAFANPSGTRYNEAAATDAWKRTLDFFAEHLR
jgi:carboxymethylenebutenolidase